MAWKPMTFQPSYVSKQINQGLYEGMGIAFNTRKYMKYSKQN